MIELKLCKFCGGKGETQQKGLFYYTECKDCGAYTTYLPSKERAAECWNNRFVFTSENPEMPKVSKASLKRCPVCGQPAVVEKVKKEYKAHCAISYCLITKGYATKKEAAEAWNRRYSDDNGTNSLNDSQLQTMP